jgi:hypothetical protein
MNTKGTTDAISTLDYFNFMDEQEK